ncbi:DUF1360 domain-containing protein [Saccharopolyspora erythraea]|nr:DUF1360 domain-containing protein [Saccharopolyspora erythraea]
MGELITCPFCLDLWIATGSPSAWSSPRASPASSPPPSPP